MALQQVHVGVGASRGQERTVRPEYLLCPSARLSALLTVEGGVRVSLSRTCQLSSEQSELDGGGCSQGVFEGRKEKAGGPRGWKMYSWGEGSRAKGFWTSRGGMGRVEEVAAGKMRWYLTPEKGVNIEGSDLDCSGQGIASVEQFAAH